MSAQIEKATLKHLNDNAEPTNDKNYDIEFMYNPTEIKLSRSISIEQSAGARNSSGSNRTSFKHPNPYNLSIANIILDAYENPQFNNGRGIAPLIEKFRRGVEFVQADSEGDSGQGKRPPIYLFAWGTSQYLYCFMKSINLKFNLFLPDGTPVRAIVDLTLEQVSFPDESSNQRVITPSSRQRQGNGRQMTVFN